MIPRANITAWRTVASWPSNEQVEQDLVLSRALVDMFSKTVVAERAIFRGGTALHKLFFGAGGRYSEDIDLVQRDAGPIGELCDAIREALDSWPFIVEDLRLLVPPEIDYDPVKAAEVVKDELITRLPGDPWKGAEP